MQVIRNGPGVITARCSDTHATGLFMELGGFPTSGTGGPTICQSHRSVASGSEATGNERPGTQAPALDPSGLASFTYSLRKYQRPFWYHRYPRTIITDSVFFLTLESAIEEIPSELIGPIHLRQPEG